MGRRCMRYERFFVTGAQGFIGRTLCAFLEEMGYDVVKIDFYNDKSGHELTPKEIIKRFSLKDQGDKKGVLVHVGADSNASAKNISELSYKNIEITKELFLAANSIGIPGIFISSSAVYGNNKFDDTDTATGNPYARSKKIGERIVNESTEITGVPNIVLRLFNAYGSREFHKKDMMSIPTKFTIDAIKRGKIEIWNIKNKTMQSRDFIYSEDVVRLIHQVCLKVTPANQTYDLGSGHSISFNEIAEKIVETFPATIEIVDPPIELDQTSYQVFTKSENNWISENGISFEFRSFGENYDAYKNDIDSWVRKNEN